MKSTYNTSDLLSEIFTNENITKDLKNYSNSLFYKHNERKLYSYQEEIAEINEFKECYILNKTARGGNYFSMTTSQHISKILNYCIENNINFELNNIV